MNASKCVSEDCALDCASLSHTFKIKEFTVQESFPFPIALTWQGSSQDSQNENVENLQSTIVFSKGNPIPSVKALTFCKPGTFTVDVQYADVSELKTLETTDTYGMIESVKERNGPFRWN